MKRALMAVTAALALLAPSAAAAAAGAESARAPSAARVVEIRVSGDAAALARVRVTSRELLRRLDVQANVRSADEPEPDAAQAPPLVVAYVDLRSVTSPSIDIEDGQTRQELTRRTISDVSSLELGVEALLHVLYLTVESSLQVSSEPRLAPAAKPSPPSEHVSSEAPTPSRQRFGFDIAPLLRLSSLGGGRIVPGAGLALEPRLDAGPGQVGLVLSGAVHGSSELTYEHGVADVRPLQFRAGPTFDWLLGSDVSACVGVTGGVDAFVISAVESPDAGQTHDGASTLDPMLTAMLGARMPITSRLVLSALASLDLDLAPASFVARREQMTETVYTLPRLRGGFTLELSFNVAGTRRFPPAVREP